MPPALPLAAVGHAVVARRLDNPSEMQIITDGIDYYPTREKIAAYHTRMQMDRPSYYEGYYITSIGPTEYAAWLEEQGKPVCCHACGRPLNG